MVDWEIGEPYLEKLGKNLEAIKKNVADAENILSKKDATDSAKKAALVLAADDIIAGEEGKSIATQVLIESALRACVKTGEYNYPPFTSKLTSAIIENGSSLFGFNFADNSIKINLFPLGHADQWVAAAHVTRLKFQIGESRKAGRSIGDMPAALKFWMEKIYKPAREGQPVIEKPRQVSLSPEMQRMGRLLKPKVSADRQAKYDKVIKDRLAQFSSKEAPFWQVINFGNQTVGHGGKSAPYPLFDATDFVGDAEKILTSLFRESISIYVPKVESALLSAFAEDIEESSRRYDTASREQWQARNAYLESVRRMVQTDVNRARAGEYHGMPIGKKTISVIDAIDVTYEVYASNLGNIFVRARGKGGRFIRSLLAIE